MLLNELREGFVQLAEGVTDAMQFLSHDRGYILQAFLYLGLRDFMFGRCIGIGGCGLVAGNGG